MSTASEREAALRRALLSAAAHIESAPGGLERIQQRLGRPRPVLIARAEAAWTVVLMRAPDVIEALRRRAANVLRLVWDRFGPNSEQGPGRPWLRWVRPLVAMSVAVFVVGAGVYIGLDSPAVSSLTGGSLFGAPGDNGSHAGGPTRDAQGTTDGSGSQPGSSTTLSTSPSPSACPSSTVHYKAPVSSSSTSSTSTTPGASTSTSTSPSPTPAPSSSSPSDSSSPATGDSGAAPDAGLASGGPAATASGGTSQSTTNSSQRDAGATQSAPSPATTGLSQQSSTKKFNPCKKPKAKHKKTSTASTSAKFMQTQPGRADAAKLD